MASDCGIVAAQTIIHESGEDLLDLWIILRDIVVLLSASLIIGGVFSRLGQSPIVGYLLAGMMLGGPGSINAVQAGGEIEAIAELGVALLLFSLGLEFSIPRLKKLGAKPLLGGAAQISLTIVLAFSGAMLLGLSIREAIAFGAMVSLSSTAVVLRILMERGEMEMPHGRNSLGVLLTQDMAVVPLALLMTILGGEGSATEVAWNIGRLLLMAAGLVTGLLLLTKIAVMSLGTLTLHRNRELTMIFAVATGLGAAWASHSAGISPALGAFVAGMLLGSSPFATQIRADVSPLQVVLLTLFFSSAGMVADPLWIISHAHWVAGAAFALTVGKGLIVAAVFLVFGQSLRVAAATGLALGQVGEFAFVLGAIGRVSGVVPDDVYALVVSVTIVSFFMSAYIVPKAPQWGDRLARLLGEAANGDDESGGQPHSSDVVVIGFGPTAQLATTPLMNSKLRVTVIELNHEGVSKAKEFGFDGHLGDATSSDVLQHASIGDAQLVIVTLPHFRSTLSIVELVRAMNPSATVLVRSRYHIHTDALSAAGAIVRGDEEQVGGAIRASVTEWLADHRPDHS